MTTEEQIIELFEQFRRSLWNDIVGHLRVMAREHVAVIQEAARLETAIRKHRDQKWDNRCWRDDLELYAALREGPVSPESLALPPKCEFLESCARYWEQRQPGVDVAGWPGCFTIAQLEAEVARLKAENVELANALREAMEEQNP